MRKRVLQQILSGASDANVRFEDLRSLLAALGFTERIRGDHHIFSKTGIAEILNLQPRVSLAKPYQVKQVRAVIVRYRLAEGIE
ncbi:MAG: type II toxin-antitoxin system HicA family toxin [Bryobacterales bacterium]|nr:type II toxin-antitoxin system HicA family toxin [Bryobacterales bacterium]